MITPIEDEAERAEIGVRLASVESALDDLDLLGGGSCA
jgi:hypothetical protein